MLRKFKLIFVCGVSTLCILLLTVAHYRLIAVDSLTSEAFNQTEALAIQDVIQLQRTQIKQDMENFQYPAVEVGDDSIKLAELTPETGGTPVRSIIMTTWRSGSTFLGEILNSIPGNYYHFEPLQPFGGMRVRGPPDDEEAIYYLKKLLKCDYSDMDYYLDFGVKLFFRNPLMMGICKEHPEFCRKSKFLTPFCKLFPLQSMKIIRLKLALAEQLLDDTSLNVRILLLVRDPRGTMQSRKQCRWCDGFPDCENVLHLCDDLVSDFYAAEILNKKYPTRFRVVRYEDLSINSYNMTKDIVQFYGLPFHHRVEEFLDTHTKNDSGNTLSTFRDSKSAPFHWITDSQWSEIENIENTCEKAMDLWGYRKMNSSKDQDKTFDPLLPAPFT